MAQTTVIDYTVVDEDSRGRQLGFRSSVNTQGEQFVTIRVDGGEMSTIKLEDYKKFLLAGEKLAELLSVTETNDTQAE